MTSAPPSELLLYQTEDGRTRLTVRLEEGTVWLTQAELAELYQTTPQNITLHIAAIYDEGELDEASTCKPYLQVRHEGVREVRRSLKHYSLPMILAVGFRVRSPRGAQFRRWATELLEEYLVKGFVMDDERLKNPACGSVLLVGLLSTSGCGPDVAGHDCGSASATSSGNISTAHDQSTGTSRACTGERFCFERFDVRDLAPVSEGQADLDGDDRVDLLVKARPSGVAILGWSDGPDVLAQTRDASCAHPMRPMDVAPAAPQRLLSVKSSSIHMCALEGDVIVSITDPIVEPTDPNNELRIYDALDVDGDGIDEVVAIGTDAMPPFDHPWVLRRFDDGWRAETVLSQVVWYEGGRAMAVGDVDGDGLDELVITDDEIVVGPNAEIPDTSVYDPDINQVVVLKPGDDYAELWRAPTAVQVDALFLHDFDDDGNDDLHPLGSSGRAIGWGDGNGGFTPPELYDLASHAPEPHEFMPWVLGDFDGDGKLDVLGAVPWFAEGFAILADPFGSAELHTVAVPDIVGLQHPFEVFDLDDDGHDDVLLVARDDEGDEDNDYLAVLRSVPPH